MTDIELGKFQPIFNQLMNIHVTATKIKSQIASGFSMESNTGGFSNNFNHTHLDFPGCTSFTTEISDAALVLDSIQELINLNNQLKIIIGLIPRKYIIENDQIEINEDTLESYLMEIIQNLNELKKEHDTILARTSSNTKEVLSHEALEKAKKKIIRMGIQFAKSGCKKIPDFLFDKKLNINLTHLINRSKEL